MTRKESIPILRELEAYFTDLIEANPNFLDKEQAEKDLEAIRYGRNSLEVDEQYQIEYEKADLFIPKSVIEDIKAEIEEHSLLTRERAIGIIDRHIGDKKC